MLLTRDTEELRRGFLSGKCAALGLPHKSRDLIIRNGNSAFFTHIAAEFCRRQTREETLNMRDKRCDALFGRNVAHWYVINTWALGTTMLPKESQFTELSKSSQY